MKNIFQITLLAFALAAGTREVRAELTQVIALNVASKENAKIGGMVVSVETLPGALATLARGDRRLRIIIYVPLGTRKDVIRQFIDACRKGGASSFKVAFKA